MVAPITGPFTKVTTYKGPPVAGISFVPEWIFVKRIWKCQAKPHNLPLDFSLEDRRVLSYSGSPYQYRSIDNTPPLSTALAAESHNKAFAKYREQLRDSSQWAVNFAEMGQTVKLIVDSASILLRFARKLDKFDFPGAAEELGLGRGWVKRRNLRRDAKYFGDNFLKYHFGWEPLVQDIGSATRSLCNDPPKKRLIKAKATSRETGSYRGSGADPQWQDWSYSDSSLIQALVEAPNPNLFLTDSLGLINPLSVLWETIPFSFVADWFGNVGQVLDSMVDIYEVDVLHSFETHFQVQNLTERFPYRVDGNVPPNPEPVQAVFRNVWVTRSVGGIPGPTLMFKLPSAVSPTRAATAISLLVQQLGRH